MCPRDYSGRCISKQSANAIPQPTDGTTLQKIEVIRSFIAENGSLDAASLDSSLENADWVVDALLGTGFQGELAGAFKTVIEKLNQAGKQVLALDVPSGLEVDKASGECCVQADLTATFVGNKQGLHTGKGKAVSGAVYFSDLSVPEDH